MTQTPALDATDIAILQAVQADASLSVAQIAERIHLSPTPCWRRIKRLEEIGAIKARVALLDPTVLGFDLTALVYVRLAKADAGSREAFEKAVIALEPVLLCDAISGDWHYQLRVAARTALALDRFLAERIWRLPGVAAVAATVALRTVKSSTRLPLGSAAADLAP
ncbi:MAG: Lrp/AsnC family transcriptional regulator [Sphingomonadales bacterium]